MFVGIIILLLILIIMSNIDINIKFLKDNKNDEIVITAKLFYGIYKYKKEIPLIDIDIENRDVKLEINEESEDTMTTGIISEKNEKLSIQDILNKIKEIKKIIRKYHMPIDYLIKKSYWQYLYWNTEVGLNDPAFTGFFTGLIYILKTNIFSFLFSKNICFKELDLKAIPNFKSSKVKTSINCIFSIKMGYIIIAGLKFLKVKYL
ncbi:DUF2953 domain-containing protein [Caminicella sporogenes]|uniref:DUF2953 domain-containing protein n=1 Tax=Caminicella sporogenes TaxID=166485 RepID=UPI00253FE096|nr:DUF2953 domain-containing protein [Caminicella sporogenes]WIF94731.1 DUF2953 domain-containing protein [Caminicella sporogenes]